MKRLTAAELQQKIKGGEAIMEFSLDGLDL